MRFDQHAFISYAHIDDQPLSPQQQGWVTRFHTTLQALLSMRIGSPARIWRDDQLHGHEIFPQEILDQFGRTAILITVLTPRYVASDWCTRELRAFCEQAERAGGLKLDNRCRVLKVMKSPLDDDAPLPEVMKDMLGYPFFIVEDGAPLELDAVYGESFAQDYNRRVCKLAWDAAQLLKQLERAEPAPPPPPQGRTVYLAECGHDLRPARERVEAELKCHGHTVLPDERLPCEDEELCQNKVVAWLARADLALHLVGRSGGAVPDGNRGEPLVALQNRLAAQRSDVSGLPRLIWLPAELEATQPAQQAFIDGLRRDAAMQRGADLLSAGLESFVQAVHHRLERLAQPKPAEQNTQEGAQEAAAPSLFLLCVSADRKPSLALRRWLRDQGIEVQLPAFEGSAAEVRASNRALLAGSDVVLIYYGAGDEAWKRSVATEIRKQRGLSERAKPWSTFTYLAEPSSGDKDDLVEMEEPHLIDGRAGLPEAALATLLESLRGERQAR